LEVPQASARKQRPQAPAAVAPASAPVAPRENDPSLEADIVTTDRPGGDFMVDVLKALNLEYVAANPGSSFRGIHESIINYGNNTAPEFITCCHEESSVAMAHGYAKVEGKPMAVLVHGTVGLQHAAMAIYNAYCDRVPSTSCAGNTLDATMRRPAWSGRTACRTPRRWCATTSSGTTCRGRCRTSPNRPCAPTRSR
jgi:hypothetical protein